MKQKKSTLLVLLLMSIGLFFAGCGCNGGECPFKKIFGSKESQTKQTSETTQTQPSAETGTK